MALTAKHHHGFSDHKQGSNYLCHGVARYLNHSGSDSFWTLFQAAILMHKAANIHWVKVQTLPILRYSSEEKLWYGYGNIENWQHPQISV